MDGFFFYSGVGGLNRRSKQQVVDLTGHVMYLGKKLEESRKKEGDSFFKNGILGD